MSDGDILEVHVDAGVAGLYPDVVTAPLRAGEHVVVPLEVISLYSGWLRVFRALEMISSHLTDSSDLISV